jgi:hypothetical protein
MRLILSLHQAVLVALLIAMSSARESRRLKGTVAPKGMDAPTDKEPQGIAPKGMDAPKDKKPKGMDSKKLPKQKATNAPTKPPAEAATNAPLAPPKPLATKAPTQAPTKTPTQAPTQAPVAPPKPLATKAPTEAPVAEVVTQEPTCTRSGKGKGGEGKSKCGKEKSKSGEGKSKGGKRKGKGGEGKSKGGKRKGKGGEGKSRKGMKGMVSVKEQAIFELENLIELKKCLLSLFTITTCQKEQIKVRGLSKVVVNVIPKAMKFFPLRVSL